MLELQPADRHQRRGTWFEDGLFIVVGNPEYHIAYDSKTAVLAQTSHKMAAKIPARIVVTSTVSYLHRPTLLFLNMTQLLGFVAQHTFGPSRRHLPSQMPPSRAQSRTMQYQYISVSGCRSTVLVLSFFELLIGRALSEGICGCLLGDMSRADMPLAA
jgi:hypothetical protein